MLSTQEQMLLLSESRTESTTGLDPVVWLLLIIFIIAFAIFIERFLVYVFKEWLETWHDDQHNKK